ncbi:S1 family peptidase [Stenotrophomonas geniculata]|uniref:S1 family peptidase n=2 Tax=Bacteria TaxID=2 RepID=UPI00066DFD1E|nr:S1 family peptidase [Stenotrophomonas geniculata]MBH1485843.1 hypothetical protein [Stenotrophomonas maltophilia]MBN5138853.1 hypothetical protein [Stenotrophomonas maltophilia]MDH7549472.1 S1 family peptidase [Stenotrophomonas geniculata]
MIRSIVHRVLVVTFLTSLPPTAMAADGQEGLSAQTITYARTYGVDAREAEARQARTLEAGTLERVIESKSPDTFAGLYIQHSPRFRVVVRFTGNAETQLSRFTNDPIYVAEQAPRSLELLLAVQDEIAAQLSARKINFETGIDIRKSEVNLLTDDPQAASSALAKLIRSTNFINLIKVQGRITPTALLGGSHVNGHPVIPGVSQNCTTGFNVKDANLELGIVTAGHCDNALITSSGTHLTFQGELNSGGFDVQWNKEAASGARQAQPNEITLIGGPVPKQEIKSVRAASTLPINAAVCKSGTAGHYMCGTIQDKNAQTEWNGTVGSYVRVRSDSGALMSVAGDSGGPIFIGDIAVGINHGHGDSTGPYPNDLYFMPIERISSLGISVLTEPFETTEVADIQGNYYVPLPIDVHYSGIPKFPITLTVETIVCPISPCGKWEVVFHEKAPTPLNYSWTCAWNTQPPPPTLVRLRTTLTDASGISTTPVDHDVTCSGLPDALRINAKPEPGLSIGTRMAKPSR